MAWRRCFGSYSESDFENASKPKVVLADGSKMLGEANFTRRGKEFVSFTRIPYAKPPLGKLRFAKPLPIGPWSHILDAGKRCPLPLHLDPQSQTIRGSEDCLYLNVYTPDLPMSDNFSRLPTMVWLQKGDFGQICCDEPEPLMESDSVVVVTINCRMGPLGFLNLGVKPAPGNQALWDQNLALVWVREHIASFGGDPDNVTLVGEGAGACCVGLHMLSSKSSGLFHKVIFMSGSVLTPAFFADRDAAVVGRRYARILGAHSVQDALFILWSKSGRDLVRRSGFLGDLDSFIPNPWVPCVDGDFISESPLTTLKRGDFNKMPILYGQAKDEDLGRFARFSQFPEHWPRLEADWRRVLAMTFFNRAGDEFAREESKIVRKIRDRYAGENQAVFDPSNVQPLRLMCRDAMCFAGLEMTCQLIRAASAQPMFAYSYEPSNDNKSVSSTSNTICLPLKKSTTPALSGEHWEFFSRRSLLNRYKRREPELPTQSRASMMVRLWANFAATSNPTPHGNHGSSRPSFNWSTTRDSSWSPSTSRSSRTTHALLTSDTGQMCERSDAEMERIEFWNPIITQLGERKPSTKGIQILRNSTRLHDNAGARLRIRSWDSIVEGLSNRRFKWPF